MIFTSILLKSAPRTYASNVAIGAVLTQDGHPISYASRTLNNHEQNYATIDKELLAVVWGVRYFRPYLFGREFELQTDHQPIKWLHSKCAGKDINPRLQRWLLQLGEYNIKIDYIKGKENIIADFLSRINDENREINAITQTEDENQDESDINIEMNSLPSCSVANLNTNNEVLKKVLEGKFKRANNLDENQQINDSEDVQTIHSQEQNLEDHIPILDTIVNRFKTQIIFLEHKEREFEKPFKNIRIFIDKNDVSQGNVHVILKNYLSKGKVGIYSNLNDREYNVLQQKIIETL